MDEETRSSCFFYNILREAASSELSDLKATKLKVLGFAISTVGVYHSIHRQRYDDVINHALRELIESFTERSEEDVNWLPLHWAAACNIISPEDIDLLLVDDPNSVRNLCVGRNRCNLLPIHLLAATARPSIEIAEKLVAAYPFSAMQWSGDGFLPLHFAARYSTSVPFVQFLIQNNERAITQRTQRCGTCLHLAVKNNCRAVLQCILHTYPDAVNEPLKADMVNGAGLRDTPFHLAIKHCNLFAVEEMLKVSPGLTRQVHEGSQEYPLHYAARCSSRAIVMSLLVADGEVMRIPSGVLHVHPLHCAVANWDVTVLECILDTLPPAFEEDKDNETAGAEEFTDPLLDARGQHPIHTLVRSEHLNTTRLHLFLKKFPRALCKADRDGNLPLHSFFEASRLAEFNAFPHTSEKGPASMQPHTEVPPWTIRGDEFTDIGKQRFAAFELILRLYPAATAVRNNRNELPLHRFCFAADSALGFSNAAGSSSPARRKSISQGAVVEMMRLVLTQTKLHCDNTALASNNVDNENAYELLTRHESLYTSINDGDMAISSTVSGDCNCCPPGGEGHQMCTRNTLKRLLLMAYPGFDEQLLRNLNYRARRMALFLGFCAGTLNSKRVNIFARLRKVSEGEIFATVVSYL
mmetsp:Transcript_12991/g.19583  ORF Transcript_12991/g.19583 Transcript_12991/m.19583 type:complete len:639 (-) Transcript_12991:225-2141(-)|eukprot:CAMPEP_0185019972 /NCGR_PEP_ID=MMETSP1103-20130426/2565_1 /TAXON_ID=36769 /ORGANISM="Paraphysomonas bandaiensis, Strain Caron Lab Isolate" /LENGTH=638 /DNA_ID=CAMNT_0027550577 /DNA_START=127 /DNA_END=2043 /DNA_ORIENTATION=-